MAFTKDRRGLTCTLCVERRVAAPAYYCSRACQKAHWPAHKAFHAQRDPGAADQKYPEDVPTNMEAIEARTLSAMEDPASSADGYKLLTQRAELAMNRSQYRQAAKFAKKAIALDKGRCNAYLILGSTYCKSGEYTSAVPHLLKVMDLTDSGGTADRVSMWSDAVSMAFMCLDHPAYVASVPAWFTDPERLKRMADRAVSAVPNGLGQLHMRAWAYAGGTDCPHPQTVATEDLSQALRDLRRLVKMCKDTGFDRQWIVGLQGVAQRIEAELRTRFFTRQIAADP